jgi:hypothetical protein
LTTRITDLIVTEEMEKEVEAEVIRTEKVRTERKTIPEILLHRRIA